MDPSAFSLENFNGFIQMPASVASDDDLFGDNDAPFDWSAPIKEPAPAPADSLEQTSAQGEDLLAIDALNTEEAFNSMFADVFAEIDNERASASEHGESDPLPADQANISQVLSDQRPTLEFPPTPVPVLESSVTPVLPRLTSSSAATTPSAAITPELGVDACPKIVRNGSHSLPAEELPRAHLDKGKGKRPMVYDEAIEARQQMAPKQPPAKRMRVAHASTSAGPSRKHANPGCAPGLAGSFGENVPNAQQMLAPVSQPAPVPVQQGPFNQPVQTQALFNTPALNGSAYFDPVALQQLLLQEQTILQQLASLQGQLLQQPVLPGQALLPELMLFPAQIPQPVAAPAAPVPQQAFFPAPQPAFQQLQQLQNPSRGVAPPQPQQQIQQQLHSAALLSAQQVEQNRLHDQFLLRMQSRENQFRGDYRLPQLTWAAFKKEVAHREKNGLAQFPFSEYVPASQQKRTASVANN